LPPEERHEVDDALRNLLQCSLRPLRRIENLPRNRDAKFLFDASRTGSNGRGHETWRVVSLLSAQMKWFDADGILHARRTAVVERLVKKLGCASPLNAFCHARNPNFKIRNPKSFPCLHNSRPTSITSFSRRRTKRWVRPTCNWRCRVWARRSP